MFLDEKGEKISKSKGNGLSIEEWLTYATPESLALYMYRAPREAKPLPSGVIPNTADQYYPFLGGYPGPPAEQTPGNPVCHIPGRTPPATMPPAPFPLLPHLMSAPPTPPHP